MTKVVPALYGNKPRRNPDGPALKRGVDFKITDDYIPQKPYQAKNDIHTYNDSVKGSIVEDLKSKNYQPLETDFGRREAFKYVRDGSSNLNKTFNDRDLPPGRTRKYY
jgi:hypothetical protein